MNDDRRRRLVVIGAWILLIGTVIFAVVDSVLFVMGSLSDTVMLFQTLLLSWGALTFTAADILQTSRVHRDVGDTE